MILVYDMSGGERLDAVPGEAMTESSRPEMGRPMDDGHWVAPAVQEIVFEEPCRRTIPLAAIDLDELLNRMA